MNIEKIRDVLERISKVQPNNPEDRYGDGGILQRVKVAASEALAELDKAQQPAAGLTVDEIIECAWNSDYIFTERMEDDLRARLTSAIEAKQKS